LPRSFAGADPVGHRVASERAVGFGGDLGISEGLLGAWVNRHRRPEDDGLIKGEREELDRSRRVRGTRVGVVAVSITGQVQ
jgi:hypothetical protein